MVADAGLEQEVKEYITKLRSQLPDTLKKLRTQSVIGLDDAICLYVDFTAGYGIEAPETREAYNLLSRVDPEMPSLMDTVNELRRAMIDDPEYFNRDF
ncbi:hypothetical protein HY495_00225 [Candidatus Woesearchaeota archaeon]|nr:hypothetical protein [Candidatus Woesearchaeota archaeon]